MGLRIMCGLPALQYLSTLSHKRHKIVKKVIEHKMCVLILCTTFVSNIPHSTKIEQDITIYVLKSQPKAPFILVRF
jgi:hypothetical protein